MTDSTWDVLSVRLPSDVMLRLAGLAVEAGRPEGEIASMLLRSMLDGEDEPKSASEVIAWTRPGLM
jgi:hypothetical protein